MFQGENNCLHIVLIFGWNFRVFTTSMGNSWSSHSNVWFNSFSRDSVYTSSSKSRQQGHSQDFAIGRPKTRFQNMNQKNGQPKIPARWRGPGPLAPWLRPWSTLDLCEFPRAHEFFYFSTALTVHPIHCNKTGFWWTSIKWKVFPWHSIGKTRIARKARIALELGFSKEQGTKVDEKILKLSKNLRKYSAYFINIYGNISELGLPVQALTDPGHLGREWPDSRWRLIQGLRSILHDF